MKRHTLLICVILIASSTFSQDVKVDLSEEMKEPSRSTIMDIVGTSPDAFYAVRADINFMKVKLTVERYDQNFGMKVSEELELEADEEDLAYEATAFFNGNLYVFGSYFSRKNDVEKLYAFKMNPQSLAIDPAPMLVASIESERNSSFSFDLSNNEKFLSITSYPGSDDDNIYAYTINVYSEDLDPLWNSEVKNKYEKYTFYARSGLVDDRGNVYILAKKYGESVKGFKLGKPAYEYTVISYTDKGQSENSFTLNLKSKLYINDINFRVMDDGTIVCGGFYSEKYGGGYKGAVFFSLDPKTGSVLQEGSKEFSVGELAEFMSERKAEKGKEIYNFDLNDIVLREDGGLVLVAEYFNVVTSTHYSNGKEYTTTRYYYNSLLVTSVNPDLTIDWVRVVPKRQVTGNDGGYFSSYAMMIKGEYINIIYNDNDKNLTMLSSNDKIANFDGKNSVVVLVRIASDGSMKKSQLIDNKEEEFILRPKVCEQVSGDQMVLYGELRSHYKVGKLTF